MLLFRLLYSSILLRIRNYKFVSFCIVFSIVCFRYMEPLRTFTLAVDMPVNWCVFPFLLCNYVFLTLFWLGILFIHSDIPFQQYYGMYQVVRTGRTRWIIGNILSIAFRSVLATVWCFLVCVLSLLPRVSWYNEWGRVLHTLAMTDIGEREYHLMVPVFSSTLSAYSPLEVLLLTILIISLIGTFMGLLMYALAIYVNRIVSVAVAAAWILVLFFPLNVQRTVKSALARWIPAIWGELAMGPGPDMSWLPSVSYMLCFLLLGILIFAVLICLRGRRMELHWVREDA